MVRDHDGNLPAGYTPYRKLSICGNQLENVQAPFLVGGHLPLLVGKGPKGPRVWLSVPAAQNLDKWIPALVDNESKMPDLDARVGSAGELVVFLGRIMVLLAVEREGAAEIVEMDLTPLGLGIRGNMTDGLWVAGSTLIGNTFRNLRAMIQLDE